MGKLYIKTETGVEAVGGGVGGGSSGTAGKPGKDGISATHRWNGTVLTITSASGTSSADLKGAPGKDGAPVTVKSVSESAVDGASNVVTFSDGKTLTVKNGSRGSTPVRGTDYWTAADIAEIKSYVDEAILGGAW